jgi:ring-1,2-phenylacetyl-CoA epoxidase subunit PaaD
MVATTFAPDTDLERARDIAAAVLDPEVPVINLQELGVLRGVARREGRLVVTLTPTYTGCRNRADGGWHQRRARGNRAVASLDNR